MPNRPERMKALFFLVCLLNVLFFFWKLHFGALTPSVELSSNLPKLILVSEGRIAKRGTEISAYLDSEIAELQAKQLTDTLQRLNPPNANPTLDVGAQIDRRTTAVRQQASVTQCYEAGPFSDQDALRLWAGRLAITEFKSIYKSKIASSDFQVYYPAARDAEQTRINKLMLKAKGFSDVWPITDGESKGALSLGVFNDRQRATRYKSQLANQGVMAEIRQRDKLRDELFIRFVAARGAGSNHAAYTPLSQADCGNE